MSYSKYKKLKDFIEKYKLSAKRAKVFQEFQKVQASQWLQQTLELSEKLPLTNEKAKTERIISPILTEVAKNYLEDISFFSGEQLNINEDLAGECDFFFTLVPYSPYLESPIISVAEAKNENLEWGIAQCAAQLYGAKLLNEKENKNIDTLYGCTTDGVEWQFIRFEQNVFYIDMKVYTDISEILGIWHHIIQFYLKK